MPSLPGMRPDVVVWGGPVYGEGLAPTAAGDIGRVKWAHPTVVITLNRGPDGGWGSDSFALLADSLTKNGRILPQILAKKGLSVDTVRHVAIAGHSAFHGLANRLLAADGDRIDAAILLDACFGAAGHPEKEGYRQFGRMAARGQKLMVYTASLGQNGPGLIKSTTGLECAVSNAEASASSAGVPMHSFALPPSMPAISPGSGGSARRAGDLFLVDYRTQFEHGQHATQLTVPTLQTFLAPYLGSGDVPGGNEKGTDNTWKWIAGAAAVAAAGAGAYYLANRRK